MNHRSLYSLILLIGTFTISCSNPGGPSGGSGTSGYVAPTQAYTITSAAGEGVDDNGQMWIAINGSFAPTGNTVSIDCDGDILYSTVQAQSSTQVVASIPAASFYNDCSFVVQSGGDVSPSFDTAITAMAISGTSHEVINSNSSLVNIELDGNFATTTLTDSVMSVLISCNSGSSYVSGGVISQSDSSIVVSLANPGKSKTDSCIFIVQDTFKDLENNEEIVSSPPLTATVSGM